MKLPILSGIKVVKALRKAGFEVDHQTGSHIIMYRVVTKDRAVVPYHSRDIKPGTLNSLLKEANIKKEDII